MRAWMWPILILALALLPMGERREIEELSLITVLAADRGGEGGVAVTAVTGVRSGEGEEPKVLTGEGESMAQACRAVREGQATHAYLGQADKLLVGEELARTDLNAVLDFVLEERELRLDTLLYIVRGKAGAGLEASAPAAGDETPGEDKRGRSVAQVLSRVCRGKYTSVPVLAPGEEGQLLPAGWAVLGPEGLVEFQEEADVTGKVVM